MRAVIYARQSRTRDGSDSNDMQVAVSREAAERFGDEVVDVLVEPPSTSGYKARGKEREKWKVLLNGFRTHQWQRVWAYKTDRYSRGGGPGWAPLLEAIEAAGLKVDQSIATPSGLLTEFEIGIRAAMDREESRKLSERQLDLEARRAARGAPHGGNQPWGYERDRITIKESEATTVREMARRIIKGHSYQEVAYYLNEHGIKTAKGHEWHGISVRSMMMNKRLAGIRTYQGQDYPASWPAILDSETWERLQLEMKLRRERAKQRPRAVKYLLTGLAYCGLCGHALSGCRHTDHHGKPERRIYVCHPQGKTQRGDGGCGKIRRNSIALDHYVTELVLDRLDTPELGKLLNPQPQDVEKVNYLLRQRNYLQTQLEERHAELFSGLLSADEYYKGRTIAQAEIQHLDDELEVYRRQSLSIDVPVNVTLRQAWDNAESSEWRRELLRLVIHKVVVNPAKSTAPFYYVGEQRCRFEPDCIEVHWADGTVT